MERKGLKVNVSKTKAMSIVHKNESAQIAAIDPCGVCGINGWDASRYVEPDVSNGFINVAEKSQEDSLRSKLHLFAANASTSEQHPHVPTATVHLSGSLHR